MDKNIEMGLQNIFSSITAKSNRELTPLVEDVLYYLNTTNITIDNPETFNRIINNKVNRITKLIAKELHEQSICDNKSKLSFIYVNYNFLENHIRELCTLREGSTCCADKSRYIIKMFLQYSLDGIIPEFDPTLEKYWIPNFGDNETWINYCNSLYSLYYGNTKNYFENYNNLLQCNIRKFKHVLHQWYLEFTDGTCIKIGQHWDDKEYSPLDGYDKGDYYIIRKNRLNGKVFEDYIFEDEEEEFIYEKNYAKVPKASVNKIYYKSEEKMV